ncbi:unnamed protein product [Adineta steineri]|uniref:Uncharacterized protein n=1 Tax=Adineta steineri TaxID=433720 RepID=A0A819PXG2_9BILA|nr:unnamed protein product [Adineta steineri]CAF4015069.1 unnamed protein product [Adineta steineri]
MTQASISMFALYLRMLIVFFVLIICINNNYVLANDQITLINDNNDDQLTDVEDSMSENIELVRRGVWSRLFRTEVNPARLDSRFSYSPTSLNYASSSGPIHIIPVDKRTIPIELQKALYAHGIVGRRR